jgi:hypothetical protein
MATQTVLMDYDVVTDVSKGFNMVATALKTVGQVLEVLIGILRASAFFSMGTSLALANYLEVIKKKVNNLSKVCTEFSQDLMTAIRYHKAGEGVKGRLFGEGIQRS